MKDWEAINRYDIISILTLCKNGKIGLTESADILMMQRQSEIKTAVNEVDYSQDDYDIVRLNAIEVLKDRGIK